jgi:prepilin-type N-terminal cleavage/methylation domain-containing protein
MNFWKTESAVNYREKGFSLIEIVIAMALVAILSTAAYTNFFGSSQRARDSKRKTDLKEIRNSLELYKMDQVPPVYPTTGAFPTTICGQCSLVILRPKVHILIP